MSKDEKSVVILIYNESTMSLKTTSKVTHGKFTQEAIAEVPKGYPTTAVAINVPPSTQVGGSIGISPSSEIAGRVDLGFNFGYGVNTFSTSGDISGLTLEKGEPETNIYSMTGKFVFKNK